MRILFANPFKFAEATYGTVVKKVDETKLVLGRKNVSFLREAAHPAVDRHAAPFAPGWNSTNDEIKANDEDGCFVLFDRRGDLVFRGRATFATIEAKVAELLRAP